MNHSHTKKTPKLVWCLNIIHNLAKKLFEIVSLGTLLCVTNTHMFPFSQAEPTKITKDNII